MSISKSSNNTSNNYFDTNHLLPHLKQLAIRGAAATVFSNTLNYVIQIAGTIVLARILTPDDFGLIAMVIVISLLFASFGGNGFTEAIIQEEVIDHSQMSTLFWINICISGFLTLMFVSSAPLLARLYNDQRIISITIVSGNIIIVCGLATLHSALLRRAMKFKYIAANTIIATLVSTAMSIAMALLGYGYWALIAKHVSFSVSITIGTWLLCKWRPGFPAAYSPVRKMVKYALNVYLNYSISYLSKSMDKVLIGKFHGSVQLGLYDRAYQLAGIFYNQLAVPTANVAVASLSRLRNNPEVYISNYTKVLSAISFLAMPLGALLALTGKDIILILLGEQWSAAGNIFIALSPGIGILIVYSTHVWLHYSLGKADRLFKWNIIAIFVTCILLFIGLPFGALGVAIAYSASLYILIIPGLLYAGQPIGLKLNNILPAMWAYYAAALFAWSICIYTYYNTSAAEIFLSLNIFIRLFITSFFYIILYLFTLIIFYRSPAPILQVTAILQDMIPGSLLRHKKE